MGEGGCDFLTDDRMTLEFSAPRDVHRGAAGENAASLRGLLADADRPPAIRAASTRRPRSSGETAAR